MRSPPFWSRLTTIFLSLQSCASPPRERFSDSSQQVRTTCLLARGPVWGLGRPARCRFTHGPALSRSGSPWGSQGRHLWETNCNARRCLRAAQAVRGLRACLPSCPRAGDVNRGTAQVGSWKRNWVTIFKNPYRFV